MVMVGDEEVAAMRFLLDGDFDSFGRLVDEIERPGDDKRFSALLRFAVSWAARARFGDGWSHADVARYAERVQAGSPLRDVPPSAFEAHILYALENRPLPPIYASDTTRTQFALSMALGLDLEPWTRGRVLAEAREQADHWLEWYDRYGPPVNGVWQTRPRCRGTTGSSGFGRPPRCRAWRREPGAA